MLPKNAPHIETRTIISVRAPAMAARPAAAPSGRQAMNLTAMAQLSRGDGSGDEHGREQDGNHWERWRWHVLSALAPAAQAQDFFSALFGGLSRGPRALCVDAVRQ